MRWKLVFLVSLVAALVAALCWFGLIVLFFNGARAFLPLDPRLWPLSLVLPLLLAIFGGFFIYRHTSRKRKTQAAITIVAVLFLSALACLAVIMLMRRSSSGRQTSPVLLSDLIQFPSAPELVHQSQT
jgi:ABC-type Na+ efflux pump permease subunit